MGESTRTLSVGSHSLVVPVRESMRARRLRIVVGDTRNGEVELVVPRGTAASAVDRFLHDHRDWILKTLTEQRARQSILGLKRPGFVWRLGEPIEVVRVAGTRAETRLGRIDERLRLGVSGSGDEAAQVVERFLREEARLVVETLCAREAPAMGVDYGRVRIGGQRSCWGSCSTSGTLSFNWRLVLCPLEIVDYVVVHELAHRLHHDHSRHFWAQVAARRPDYQRQERWLKHHGLEVRLWSPSDALTRQQG